MRPPLPNVVVFLRQKAGPHFTRAGFIPVEGLPLLVGKTRPMRDARLESMSQVHEFLLLEQGIHVLQGAGFVGGRAPRH